MLSRAAQRLYRVGTHLERADHLARLVDVHEGLWLDRTNEDRADLWRNLLEAAGATVEAKGDIPRREAIDRLVIGDEGPSIQHSMRVAREAAMAVRPSLSTEVWEQLNALHWRLDEGDRSRYLHGLLNNVQVGVHLVFGLIDDTMSHVDSWRFLHLGKGLERAANVVRLVTTRLVQLGDHPEPGEWAAVLRGCSAFEAYRWRFSTEVTAARVADFLLLDRDLPRSAAYCVRDCLAAAVSIDGPSRRSLPQRLLGQLSSLLEYAEAAELVSEPESFARTFLNLSRSVELSLNSTYFQPSKIAPDTATPTPMWAQSQQQQQ
jgi:uncharacterized alpha-E superfamily protein